MPLQTTEPASKRCAIYTRKSSVQWQDNKLSSLEAQRAICSAFVTSQVPHGWSEIGKHYDDGGKSGGNTDRPALQDLLSDVENGLVDVIVVYKLDRISRSLLDFVKLMDLFDSFGVEFVAVTQNFDTRDSTGRLILNVLLTFAQFEREIASDRLRDKFTAMKQRGMFAGGHPPFGYYIKDKQLEIHPEDGDHVRWMFERYIVCQRYTTLKKEAAERGIKLRSRVSVRGVIYESRFPSVAGVAAMLGNPVYVGEVRSKGKSYPGAHDAIVSRELWDQVQEVRAKGSDPKPLTSTKTIF